MRCRRERGLTYGTVVAPSGVAARRPPLAGAAVQHPKKQQADQDNGHHLPQGAFLAAAAIDSRLRLRVAAPDRDKPNEGGGKPDQGRQGLENGDQNL